MDLSFSRRPSRALKASRQRPDLAILLARIAARQALSPTSRREAEVARQSGGESVLPCKAELFAPDRARRLAAPSTDGSFNAMAAKLLVNDGQQK